MEIKLRDYQEDLYNKIRNEFAKGHKGVCCELPCRAGKSYIMAKIAQSSSNKEKKVLILAHRNSLINQHKELFESLELENKNIRIESVFTEVNHLGENGPVDLIIIDEGHISGASSYQKVCEYYNCRRILFTATPARLDGKPLNLADVLVSGISITELIKRNCVSDFDYYAPNLDINIDKVSKVAGDYNNKELGNAVRKPTIYGDILKYYKMLGDNRQAIAYCVNIEHSKDVCQLFNDNGIKAAHMDAKTNEKEREKIMDEFKKGNIQILCNCNLISEGITLPSASVGLLLRPTLSLPLYIQQACRVLTPVEGKKAVIIDYVGNVFRHGLPTDDREWSLKGSVKPYYNENDDGTLKIRVCQNCFSTFKTAPVCPYCGATYQTTAVEIQNMKEIELKKIKEEKERKRQEIMKRTSEKVKNYKKPEECKNFYELVEMGKRFGYKPGWAIIQARRLHLYKK